MIIHVWIPHLQIANACKLKIHNFQLATGGANEEHIRVLAYIKSEELISSLSVIRVNIYHYHHTHIRCLQRVYSTVHSTP